MIFPVLSGSSATHSVSFSDTLVLSDQGQKITQVVDTITVTDVYAVNTQLGSFIDIVSTSDVMVISGASGLTGAPIETIVVTDVFATSVDGGTTFADTVTVVDVFITYMGLTKRTYQ